MGLTQAERKDRAPREGVCEAEAAENCWVTLAHLVVTKGGKEESGSGGFYRNYVWLEHASRPHAVGEEGKKRCVGPSPGLSLISSLGNGGSCRTPQRV